MKKKLVVIGGGFAGSHVAKQLDRDFDVTLIDSKNYFEFTPSVLRTIVEPENIKKIQVLHSHYLKWAKVIVGHVSEVGKDFVLVGKKRIDYDYLAICSGSGYSAPFKESDVVVATRASHLRDCYEDLCKARRILVIGGGLVGVELAGEIIWKYGGGKEVTIAHSHDRLISRNNSKAIKYAESYLKKKGVKIIFNEKIVERNTGVCVTDKGRKIEADMVFLCTGIIPNFDFMKKNFSKYLNKKNQIKVDENLKVVGLDNVFAAGDVTDRSEEKTAQNAERQAEVIVHNIKAKEHGGGLCKYKPKMGPMVISLGPNNGIFTSGGFCWGGWIPGKMKSMIEWKEMMKKR